MRKILTLVSLVLVTAVITFLFLHEHFTGNFPWETSHSKNVIQATLYSKILKEDRPFIVRLPRDYDSLKKYPVMYVLDGSLEDGSITNSFDVLSAAGYAPATIIVGIPNLSAESRQRDYTPPYLRMDIDQKDSPLGEGNTFLSFLEIELIPYIEQRFSASQVRLLSGNSRGGLLVMHSLAYKPDLFQARFCYSSPFWRENQLMVSKTADFLNVKDTLNTFLYMSVGNEETANIKRGFSSMTQLFKKKAPYGLVYYAYYTKNADHQDNAKLSSAVGIGKWGQYMMATNQ